MIYPSIDQLLEHVDSKYSLAIISARRSKEMKKTNFYQKPLNEYKSDKTIGKALEEIVEGLVVVKYR